MNETVYAEWEVSPSSLRFTAAIIFAILTFLFLFSFLTILIFQKSTNLFLLAAPIILFFVWVGSLPDLLKSWGVVKGNYQVYITERGIYKRTSDKDYQFISWEQIVGYDLSYVKPSTPLGKFFSWPTRFVIKSKFSEDSFDIQVFGEDVDVTRAYLKEKNIPFGFIQ